ncbi:Protein-only RNase P C-terminal [Trinorchestia longiramus]|nr:Protein-only RNase P C-terminal [Trinorchestia longiramus]
MSALAKAFTRQVLSVRDSSLRIYAQRHIGVSACLFIQQLQKPLTISQMELESKTLAAFKSGNFEDGWKFLSQLPNQKPTHLTEFYKNYFESCGKLTKDERVAASSQLLQQLEKWQVLLDKDAAGLLVATLAGTKWDIQPSTINAQSGECERCGATVKKVVITDEWFDLLKSAFVQKVLLPEEVFVKSTPVEWERFNTLLAEKIPFTHVIDTASVAGSGFLTNPFLEPIAAPKYVLSAVEQIKATHPASKLLVVCREYMKGWHPSFQEKLAQRATVFFRQNPHDDDAYFLYAAMMSGITCKFISR